MEGVGPLEETTVAIVYNSPVGPEGFAYEASRDVLEQVEAVRRSLVRLGIPSVSIALTRDVRAFVEKLTTQRIRYAFNLAESVDENPELVWHPAAVMEILGVFYTGSPPMALAVTTDKVLTKQLLEANGIHTPKHITYEGRWPSDLADLRYPIIVKPRFQDASIGIEQDSIVTNENHLRQKLPELFGRFGSLLLEEYIVGREFNISLFGYPTPQVLPIAEICFDAFPDNVCRIVGYKAKWSRDSFEYLNTPRMFPRDLSKALERRICQTAMHCFQCFRLRDYGRVDMRVDPSGVLYVLEINANPCISPDSGLPAALAQGGVGYQEFVKRFLDFLRMREKAGRVLCQVQSYEKPEIAPLE
jgi:D-alanine-D-alanine ligase